MTVSYHTFRNRPPDAPKPARRDALQPDQTQRHPAFLAHPQRQPMRLVDPCHMTGKSCVNRWAGKTCRCLLSCGDSRKCDWLGDDLDSTRPLRTAECLAGGAKDAE